ncbi:MAG TPA: GAF domain-containing protein [Phycisphaerales bacterium]|nr:GAF domain-containing protein [Phycisphaerales bacterium]
MSTDVQPSIVREPLEAVVITGALAARPYRGPDYKAENAALVALMGCLASDPASVLGLLVGRVMELTHAHSAGISIAEPAPEDPAAGPDGPCAVFRWRATAGAWAKYEGGTLPRHASPCGTVLQRGGPILMARPERHYAIPPEMQPPIAEVLLVPFGARPRGSERPRLVGTVWALAHDLGKQFDREDLRIIESLAAFTAAAHQFLESGPTAARAV